MSTKKIVVIVSLISTIALAGWYLVPKKQIPTDAQPIKTTATFRQDLPTPTIESTQDHTIAFPVLSQDDQSIRYLKITGNTIEDNTFWELKTDGTKRQLTFDHIDEIQNIIWSPNREKALILVKNNPEIANNEPAFHTIKFPELAYVMYLYDLKTNVSKVLSDKIKFATWSPDGSKIAYAYDDRVLTIANPDGSDYKSLWDITKDPTLSKTKNFFFALSWPQPDTIVLDLANLDISGTIYHINPLTGVKKKLLSSADVPIPSPDGKRGIAYGSNKETRTLALWGEHLIGKNISPISTRTRFPDLTAWNPDNQHVYVVENELYTTTPRVLDINSDNGAYTTLTWPGQPFGVSDVLITKTGDKLYLVGYNQIRILNL
ncbi:MAG: hypothetical protein HZA35_02660 [Parcubacteria group bacterium]|nr:hypothetical protein [Parcubacteria group bacterium]